MEGAPRFAIAVALHEARYVELFGPDNKNHRQSGSSCSGNAECLRPGDAIMSIGFRSHGLTRDERVWFHHPPSLLDGKASADAGSGGGGDATHRGPIAGRGRGWDSFKPSATSQKPSRGGREAGGGRGGGRGGRGWRLDEPEVYALPPHETPGFKVVYDRQLRAALIAAAAQPPPGRPHWQHDSLLDYLGPHAAAAEMALGGPGAGGGGGTGAGGGSGVGAGCSQAAHMLLRLTDCMARLRRHGGSATAAAVARPRGDGDGDQQQSTPAAAEAPPPPLPPAAVGTGQQSHPHPSHHPHHPHQPQPHQPHQPLHPDAIKLHVGAWQQARRLHLKGYVGAVEAFRRELAGRRLVPGERHVYQERARCDLQWLLAQGVAPLLRNDRPVVVVVAADQDQDQDRDQDPGLGGAREDATNAPPHPHPPPPPPPPPAQQDPVPATGTQRLLHKSAGCGPDAASAHAPAATAAVPAAGAGGGDGGGGGGGGASSADASALLARCFFRLSAHPSLPRRQAPALQTADGGICSSGGTGGGGTGGGGRGGSGTGGDGTGGIGGGGGGRITWYGSRHAPLLLAVPNASPGAEAAPAAAASLGSGGGGCGDGGGGSTSQGGGNRGSGSGMSSGGGSGGGRGTSSRQLNGLTADEAVGVAAEWVRGWQQDGPSHGQAHQQPQQPPEAGCCIYFIPLYPHSTDAGVEVVTGGGRREGGRDLAQDGREEAPAKERRLAE